MPPVPDVPPGLLARLGTALLSLLSFTFVFLTGIEFLRFVSYRAVFYTQEEVTSWEWRAVLHESGVWRPLVVDLGLILLFVVQHSIMAAQTVKSWTVACCGVLQRSLYVLATAATLQVLMRYWQKVDEAPPLWSPRSEPWNNWLPLACFVLHTVAWLVIFSVVLIFDYPELMGLKQVYYYCLGLGDPLALKSHRAQRLYAHLRHPVYVEFLVILWAVPCFTLDRLLLAFFFTLYLTCAHGLDEKDYRYLRAQLDKKFEIFSREESGYEYVQNGSNPLVVDRNK
ncbi:nurim [Latimeria chalumnae]|uniref:nurim n=1 Tax=Latimeria chalumnae TaxID=7897 RepID=UPI0006D8E668|nr:PREDICTED: nurim [Latimeria chalumnae]|eukprot:XP_006013414.2 PREDICTED: nurim [Latimeria chalumnae]